MFCQNQNLLYLYVTKAPLLLKRTEYEEFRTEQIDRWTDCQKNQMHS